MKKILFVCTGNTCRSPIAEAIFNNLNKSKDIIAHSAGISVFPGSKTSNNSKELIFSNLGVDFSNRKAVQLTNIELDDAHIILTMTSSMKRALIDALTYGSQKVYTLCEYVGENGDVIDPYGGDLAIYEKTYSQLEKLINKLLLKIKEEEGIL
ncbi:low molecular weight protein arginine phosphatase [Clostridium intestinale]|uniref:low molecular weight protein arginine phosphatase n=1 Tax=Clostridium intestinale TaxID=36845 RepID=UPI002DD66F12|nr:low molecular weight protein arginine phosphatase [Clostridium intestinale]WRY49890.1 low molecular weight protein arginine phosphatase [Clostridium intestinale]